MQDPGIRRAQGSPPGPVTIHPRMSTLPSGAPSPLPTSPLQDPASHRSVDATAPHPAPCAANMFLRAEVANTWKYRGKALQMGLESLTLHSVPSPRHVLSCGAHGGPSFWRGTGRKPAGRACPSRQPQFCRWANQAGCWRRQMAGGANRGLETAGGHRHMLHELACLENRKATVSSLRCPHFGWVLTPF